MKATASSESGFTFLEVMIALAIVALALVSLLSLANRSIAVQETVAHLTQATLLAQHKMSELEVAAEKGDLGFETRQGTFDAPFEGYRWSTSYQDTPLPSVVAATVTVAWGQTARNELVELRSLLPRKAPSP